MTESMSFPLSFKDLSNAQQVYILDKVRMRIGSEFTEDELESVKDIGFEDWFVKEIQPEIERLSCVFTVGFSLFGGKYAQE